MTRRMLINAMNPAELRVAITSDKTLDDYKIDVAERGLTRGNIYFGIIANIQPSLNAAFIDYGAERHGFLAIQDVVPDAYYKEPQKGSRARIERVLEKGQPIVVQVTREPEGSKGAALTTNLSLAGRYLVLMPFEDTLGVSRKVESEEQRRSLRELVDKLEVPSTCGVIVRTNALDQTKTTLNRDLNALLRLWKRIGNEARASRKTKLLYSDQDIVLQALRDHLDASVAEVLVDDDIAYSKCEDYMRAFMPRSKTQLVRYSERAPIFAAHGIEQQIERIYERQVYLPAGGSIVIDPTEALTAIDVNSGKSTKATSQEETAVNTNLEAATEVARQLRLRDIGGLVVVDFIDMRNRRNQSKVEKTLRDAMKPDKARCSIGRISSNGLLEINRQRMQQAIQLRTHRSCPTCSGTGRIESPELVSLHLTRSIEARAVQGFMKGVKISLHPELADFIQNERRSDLLRLEEEFDLKIEIVASSHLHRAEQEIDWFARDRSEIKRLEEEQAEEKRKAREMESAASISGAETPALASDYGDLDDQDEGEGEGESEDEAESRQMHGGQSSSRPPRKRSRSRRRGSRRSRKRAAKPAGDSSSGTSQAGQGSASAGATESGSSGSGNGDARARPAKKATRRRRRPRRRKKAGPRPEGDAPSKSSAPTDS